MGVKFVALDSSVRAEIARLLTSSESLTATPEN